MTLTDCISKVPAACELWIVQTGETFTRIRAERDPFTQAVLPLDASIIDGEGAALDEVLDNDPFQSLIAALGVGIAFAQGEAYASATFHPSLLRYHKIVLVMDETPEGVQIRSRLLFLLREFFFPLVAEGHIYTSSTPAGAAIPPSETRILVPVRLST